MDGPPRRRFLTLLGTTLAVGGAGCNTRTETEDTPADSGQQEPEDTATQTNTPELSISISTATQPAQLPPIWSDHTIGDFQAQFIVETSGAPESVTVSNGNVELRPDSEQWTNSTLTVHPVQSSESSGIRV